MIRAAAEEEEEEYEYEQGDTFSSSEFAGLIGNPFEIESSSNSHGPNRDRDRNRISHPDHSHDNNDNGNGRGSNKQRRSIRKPRSHNSSRFSRDHRSPSSSSWYVLLGIVCVTLGALYSKYLSPAGVGGNEEEDRLLDPALEHLKSKFAKDEEVDYSQYSIHEGSSLSTLTRGSLAPTPMPTEDNLIVKRIALIGERNSGLSWLQSKLEKCYPRIPVSLDIE